MESEMAKQIKWRAPATFEMVQYADGTGDLLMVTMKPVEGVEITGNGSLQAPLTIAVAPGYRIVREG
jgi:RecB family endonuclease NucS